MPKKQDTKGKKTGAVRKQKVAVRDLDLGSAPSIQNVRGGLGSTSSAVAAGR